MLSSQQFGQLSQQLHTKGGFTVNVHTGEQPTTGISVSDLRGERSHPLSEITGQHIQAYAEQKKGKRLSGPHRYLGGWADKSVTPHAAVLDRSTVYPQTPWGRSKSYVRMVANFQKAAYDFDKGEDDIKNPAYEPDRAKTMRRLQGQNVP